MKSLRRSTDRGRHLAKDIPFWDNPKAEYRLPQVRASAIRRQREHFRKLLTAARHDADLTQSDLAKRLGRPQSFVSKIEIGERRLDVVEFLHVARAIGVDPVKLIAELQHPES